MKPGNLIIKVPNPAATQDEGLSEHTSDTSVCADFFI